MDSTSVSADVSVADQTENFSGADLQGVLSSAQLEAVHQVLDHRASGAVGATLGQRGAEIADCFRREGKRVVEAAVIGEGDRLVEDGAAGAVAPAAEDADGVAGGGAPR